MFVHFSFHVKEAVIENIYAIQKGLIQFQLSYALTSKVDTGNVTAVLNLLDTMNSVWKHKNSVRE